MKKIIAGMGICVNECESDTEVLTSPSFIHLLVKKAKNQMLAVPLRIFEGQDIAEARREVHEFIDKGFDEYEAYVRNMNSPDGTISVIDERDVE